MKINLNWLAEYVDLRVSFDELIQKINTQLGEIETIEDLEAKYNKATIVKVVEVGNHPNADNLKLCLIDDNQSLKSIKRNGQGLIEVVCGASNVKPSMLAVWLPPSSTIPASFNDSNPIVLEAKTIRGQISYGMLASIFELDLGTDKDGILEIPYQDGLVGKDFAKTFGLNTKIIDIENKMFTHRPDCFGLLGVAREIAAITKSSFKEPQWYALPTNESTIDEDKDFKLSIASTENCSRFRAFLIDDVTIKPSDLKMQFRLISLGIKPVNNIVDLTNYMMYLTAQPSHAFDYDKLISLSSNSNQPLKLEARLSTKGEKLKLLNGKTIDFKDPALVIATDSKPVALAGIMGGADSEIDSRTKKIVLEIANFNQHSIHRSSMIYGVFSEASTRFTKGQNPRQIPPVANCLVQLIAQSSDTNLESEIYEVNHSQAERLTIKTSAQFINDRLGCQLKAQTIAELLNKVELKTSLTDSDDLIIEIPFWRTDIEIEEDIVEEIGRLNEGGYMALTPVLPGKVRSNINSDNLFYLENIIRQSLATRGVNEVISYSFISKDLALDSKQDLKTAFKLLNPLNPNLAVYRQSVLPSLVEKAKINLQFNHSNFALFELGCVHKKDKDLVDEEGLPIDLRRLALVCNSQTDLKDKFYLARRYLDLVAQAFNLEFKYEVAKSDNNFLSRIFRGSVANIKLGDNTIGQLGIIQSESLAGFEIDLNLLFKYVSNKNQSFYKPVSRFPKISQDLTLQIPLNTSFDQFLTTVEPILEKYEKAGLSTEFELVSIFQSEKMHDTKNISLRIEVSCLEKTIKKQEVASILEDIVKICSKELKAHQVV